MRDNRDFNIDGSMQLTENNNGTMNQHDRRKDCNNNITINKYEYKEVSEEEIQRRKEREESERYGLIVNLGKVIKCIAILTNHVSKSKIDGIERYTLLNIVDKETNEFLSDHMQIDKNEVDNSISKKYRENNLCMVEIVGRVEKYGDGNDRIAVDITKNDFWYIKRIDKSFTQTDVCDFKVDISFEERHYVDLQLHSKEDYKLISIINKIRHCINKYTRPNNICDDYIYNYVIHQYLINKHHRDIYLGELPHYRLNINHYIDIIHILNYILIGISKIQSSDIITILRAVTNVLCSFMGLEDSKRYKDCDNITQFAFKMGVERYEVVDIIDYMIKDFKLQNVPIISKDVIVKSSQCLMFKNRNSMVNIYEI